MKYCNCGYAETNCSKGCEVDKTQRSVVADVVTCPVCCAQMFKDSDPNSVAAYLVGMAGVPAYLDCKCGATFRMQAVVSYICTERKEVV